MSKWIKLTPDAIEKSVEKFKSALAQAKLDNGVLTYTESFNAGDNKATVIFSEKAWYKTNTLVERFDSEVAWHGIARRGDGENMYVIEDILVYPQIVTGVTVTTDQVEYQNWLMSLPDDIFNNLRMQGHSHVRMGTSPSPTDMEWYRGILSQMDDTMFYIFLVQNKQGDKTALVYDMQKNILFEPADVTVKVENDNVSDFYNEAKKLVRDKVYTSIQTANAKTTHEKNGQQTTVSTNGFQKKKRLRYADKIQENDDTLWDFTEYPYYGF